MVKSSQVAFNMIVASALSYIKNTVQYNTIQYESASTGTGSTTDVSAIFVSQPIKAYSYRGEAQWSRTLFTRCQKQDSWAIAKKTARCAQYGCPEKFWESSLRTRLLLQKFVVDFFPIDTKNVRTKVEVRSFTRSSDNRGNPKIWEVPGYAHVQFFPKILKGFCSDGPCKYTCQTWSS